MKPPAAVSFLLLASAIAVPASARPLDHLDRVQQRIEAIQQAISDSREAAWSAGATPVAAMPDAQRRRLLGARPGGGRASAPAARIAHEPSSAQLDWREKGAVTPVRNQGGCGSCWAFSTTGALESYFLRTGGDPERSDLSEQAVLECSGGGSCEGGWPDKASEFLKATGVPPEADLAYRGEDGPCEPAEGWRGRAQKIGEFQRVERKVSKLKAALEQYGPLPTVMAVYEDFYTYEGGAPYVHVSPRALPVKNPIDRLIRKLFKELFDDLDKPKGYHAVLIVGYDDDDKAFIVKNSWGRNWGEDGYFRVAYSQVRNTVRFGDQTLAFVPPEEGPELAVHRPDEENPVSGPIQLHGSVSRPSDVEFVIDGAPQALSGEERFDGDWSYSIGALSEGNHEVVVRARDEAGGLAETRRRFTVEAPPDPDEPSGDGPR
ncbi:MAG: hypothetical protein HY553_02090 [Elusimicrobia bacterium]|nr:hypothetical protein [Elusimicrobiota bacterium]